MKNGGYIYIYSVETFYFDQKTSAQEILDQKTSAQEIFDQKTSAQENNLTTKMNKHVH